MLAMPTSSRRPATLVTRTTMVWFLCGSQLEDISHLLEATQSSVYITITTKAKTNIQVETHERDILIFLSIPPFLLSERLDARALIYNYKPISRSVKDYQRPCLVSLCIASVNPSINRVQTCSVPKKNYIHEVGREIHPSWRIRRLD